MTVTFGYVDSSGGARICYVTEPGHGTPILFVLNTLYPCASVLAHSSGEMILKRGLAHGASWYTFDWRSSGKSTNPAGSVSFTDLVDDIEAVAEAIGEPFDVNAVNDGCGMALAFAARRPEMVRRMLLVAPQGPHALSDEGAASVHRAFLAEPVGVLAQYLMWVHPGTDPIETFELAKKTFEATPLDVGLALQRAANDMDMRVLVPAVTAPCFLLHTGDNVQDAVEFAANMRCARAANWTEIGDGTINGAAWRRAWDELFPPVERLDPSCQSGDPALNAGLSPREAEVLALLCRGLSNSEIAALLVIEPSTAKRHVANVFAKLGVSSRPKAIALVHELSVAATPGAGPAR